MNAGTRVVVMLLCATFGAACLRVAVAQTPGEIPKPWTYDGSMRLQQQEHDQQRQPQSEQSGQQPTARPGGPDAANGAAMETARRMWLKRPALPPERNPLIGVKWARPASTQAKSSDPFAALLTMAKGGLCDVLFGGGFFEFRADTLVGYDPHTREKELDRVEYRGDAKHVVVIPRTTIRLMEFDVQDPDRINWASQNCQLVRAGAVAHAPVAQQSIQSAALGKTIAANDRPGGVLSLSVNSMSPAGSIVGGRSLWVLSKDPQVLLIDSGFQPSGSATVLQSWMRACQSRLPACQQGLKVIKAYTVGIATTDADGHAQSPPLPSARYWVLGDTNARGRHVIWNQPVDLVGTPTSLMLDEHNAATVD